MNNESMNNWQRISSVERRKSYGHCTLRLTKASNGCYTISRELGFQQGCAFLAVASGFENAKQLANKYAIGFLIESAQKQFSTLP